MGGNLFGTERVTAEVYYDIVPHVLSLLSHHDSGIRAEVVPHFRSKETFGDLDIVTTMRPLHAVEMLELIGVPISRNEDVVSFMYTHEPTSSGFQVDLICVAAVDFDVALAYFSYNDLGNMIGRICHKMGLKFGHSGLIYPVRLEHGIAEDVVVSKDFPMILAFLGLGPGRWARGFDTRDEIFEFVASSKYFSPDIFDPQRNHYNRTKNAKRDSFRMFTDWLELNKPSANFYFDADVNRESYLSSIADFFGWGIVSRIDTIKKIGALRKELNDRFSGELFISVTGLQGKELGAFITEYRSRHTMWSNNEAGSWLDPSIRERWEFKATQEEIENDIREKYAAYKGVVHGSSS